MSMPPSGGSIRITSAPRLARQAPPSGAAMKAEISTIRSPERIGGAGSGIRPTKIEQVERQRASLDPPDHLLLTSHARLTGLDRLGEGFGARHEHTVRVADHDVARPDLDPAYVHRLADRSRLLLLAPPHADPSAEHRKLEPLEGVDVADAAVDHSPYHAARDRGIRDHVAAVAGPVAAGVDDEDVARTAALQGAVHRKVVALGAPDGERGTAHRGAFPGGSDRGVDRARPACSLVESRRAELQRVLQD